MVMDKGALPHHRYFPRQKYEGQQEPSTERYLSIKIGACIIAGAVALYYGPRYIPMLVDSVKSAVLSLQSSNLEKKITPKDPTLR